MDSKKIKEHLIILHFATCFGSKCMKFLNQKVATDNIVTIQRKTEFHAYQNKNFGS